MIIGLTGKKQHGKDTTGQHLVSEHGFVRVAFADKLRDMALGVDPVIAWSERGKVYLSDAVKIFGWEVTKSRFPEARRFLQRLGTEGVREVLGDSTWVDAALSDLDPDGNYVITDVRFLNEANAVWEHSGVVWKIYRPGYGDDGDTHASEVELEQIEYDRMILNEDPFPDRLVEQVDELLQSDELPSTVVG